MAFLCPVRIKRSKKKKSLHDDAMVGLASSSSSGLLSAAASAPAMGRITGSASIETLVRVGIEKENGLTPESKMVVLHDFTPCVDDELEVSRGQVVHVLYQENDWVYVISEDNREGFIPHSYCAQFGSQMASLAMSAVRKKLPRETGGGPSATGVNSTLPPGKATSMNGLPTTAAAAANASMHFQQQQQQQQQQGNPSLNNSRPASNMGVNNISSAMANRPPLMSPATNPGQPSPPSQPSTMGTLPHLSSSLMGEPALQPDVHPFSKDTAPGRYVVLYSYAAQDENDLAVERGQCVTLLNSEDPDWCWVARYDGCEGFVPSGFIYPLDAIHRQNNLNNVQKPVLNQPFVQHAQTMMQHQQQAQPQQPHRSNISKPQQNSMPQFQVQPHQQPQSQQLHQHKSYQPHPQAPNVQQPFQQQQPQQFAPQGSFPVPLGSAGGSSGPSSYSTTNGERNPNVNGLPTPTSSLLPLPQGSGSGSTSAASASLTLGSGQQQQPQQPGVVNGERGGRYHGTELVMLYDYKAQAPDDLSVRRGDWVYADLSNQTVDGWLWSFAPKSGKYGFIPKAYARPPAMTSL